VVRRGTWFTIAFLLLVVGGVMATLLYQTSQGPTFRAEAYDSWEECMKNIPEEWAPGTLARTGAESACSYTHERGRPRRP
jgi:quinol-cytochrome oxidoreductase complex cytochrome b subunit